MVLDKALLLKGVAGVAAVGGTVGGGIVYKSLSSSKKEAEKKPTDPTAKKVPISGEQEDQKGIPTGCEDSKTCDITEDSIKKIKFQALGDGEEEVTVTPESGINVTLTIKGDGETKRYIFENKGSSEVTLTKGSATLKLPVGKTRFTKENENKLKKLETGTYGLPSRCVNNTPCTLIEDDLEQIKFSGLSDEGESTVDNFTTGQTITLTIEGDKYIFNNNSSTSVTIKNGSTTVDLDQGETDFTVLNNKLKKVDLWDFGLPESCKFTDGSNPKTCTLTPRDLKKVKFKDIGNSPTVSVSNNAENVTLKIEKVEDSSYPDQRKYIFTPTGSSNVTITGSSHSITLTKGEENIFKKENDYLVNVPKKAGPSFETADLDNKIKPLGLPKTCTFAKKASGTEKSIECELSLEELKKLKFDGKDNATFSGGHGEGNNGYYGDPKTYKIKIEDSGDEEQFRDKKIRITFLNKEENTWSSDLVITGGDNSALNITNNTNTEFKINSQNKLEKAWKESTLSALVGLKCPKGGDDDSGRDCTLKEGQESIKVFIDNQAKDFKPTNSTDIENNICFSEGEYNQGIKFTVKNEITGSDEMKLENGSYEIRRTNGQEWRFTKN